MKSNQRGWDWTTDLNANTWSFIRLLTLEHNIDSMSINDSNGFVALVDGNGLPLSLHGLAAIQNGQVGESDLSVGVILATLHTVDFL